VIENSANHLPIENLAVSQSTEVPNGENGDETMVKQVTAEINREDEIEEGDPPVESTSAVRNTIIIDNIEYQEVMPEFSVAVQTRAQAKREVQSIRPLKMTMVDELNLTPDEFKKLQEDDINLKVCWDKAKTIQQLKQ